LAVILAVGRQVSCVSVDRMNVELPRWIYFNNRKIMNLKIYFSSYKPFKNKPSIISKTCPNIFTSISLVGPTQRKQMKYETNDSFAALGFS